MLKRALARSLFPAAIVLLVIGIAVWSRGAQNVEAWAKADRAFFFVFPFAPALVAIVLGVRILRPRSSPSPVRSINR